MTTRSQARAAFNHILDNIFGHPDGSPLKTALINDGISDLPSLLTMDNATIDSLCYPDTSNPGASLPVNKGDRNLVRIFRDFVVDKNRQGTPISDFLIVTSEEFDSFRINPAYLGAFSNIPSVTPSTASISPPSVSNKQTPSIIFSRGIKRDQTLFPTLKDERFNDAWHRSFLTQARAQDVEEVLEANYKPSTPDEVDLFQKKQKYVYAVLEAKVLTDRGRAIVREHEADYDAQAAYQKLINLHLRSTKAQIESAAILSYITSIRLGCGDWKGSTEAFIIHWQNQVRLYERQVPSSDHFSDGQKRIMLENAVAPIQELRQVKSNADLEKTKTGRALTYDEYSSLLLAAASAYDDQFKQRREKRQVLFHNMESFDDTDIGTDIDEAYGIDEPVQVIQANIHKQRNPTKPDVKFTPNPARMSRDKWHSLQDKDRQIWDRLDDRAKAIILGNSKVPDTTIDPLRRINLHEISVFELLQAHFHETEAPSACAEDNNEGDGEPPDPAENSRLINMVKSGGTHHPPGDIRRVLSKKSTRSVNTAETIYSVSSHRSTLPYSLVDRGANGGIAGLDVRVIHRTHRSVDVRGIDNHQLTNIDIGSVGGVVETQKGPVIAIMHQYALVGKGSSIHSAAQLEWFKNDVNDKAIKVGGLQRITTLDGYVIPLIIQEGLPRMNIRPFTDKEWDTLPHVFLTGEQEWDPAVLDHDLTSDEQWADAVSDLEADPTTNLFDEFGNYRHRVIVQHTAYFTRHDGHSLEDIIDQCVFQASDSFHEDITFYDALEHEQMVHEDPAEDLPRVTLPQPKTTTTKSPDWTQLRPLFGWLSPDIIQKTFEHTTQYARLPTGTHLKRSFKSSNPALNVHRRKEPVACDIVYADVPAVDDGSTAAVIFVGVDTQVTDVYGIKTDRQFVNTLEDNIRERGAPNKLISDRAQVEISNKVLGILRALVINSWQSEPHQQQQNHAERRYQTIKNTANRIMDRTGAPPFTWLLCLTYVCFLLNHTFNSNIKGIPLTHLTGVTVDISPLLRFHFWQKVYFLKEESSFPSQSKEGIGYIVGISEHCGPAMTWKILTADTKKIIYRSQVRPATEMDPNKHLDILLEPEEQESSDSVIKSRVTSEENKTPIVDPYELVGRSFLLEKDDNGERHRANIIKLIEDHENNLEKNTDRVKFLCSVNEDKAEEVFTYNELLKHLASDEESDILWKFRRITSHQGPLKPGHPDYKGSTYNVLIEWENGEITTEPLSLIAADDPVTCAIYARDNNLLDQPGWKKFKGIAKREKKFTRMVNQAKLRSYNTAPRYKYGFEVPRNYNHALEIDKKNNNTKWKDAANLELKQIDDYGTFIDHGHQSSGKPPPGYKKIRAHMIFDVKYDGRHKARLVADGHLTEVPVDSVYSGVVSLKGLRLVVFLAELNNLELWATDVGNAYLEAVTSEKVYIIAGAEFGDREDHILVIHKALYGLRSSGARWHDRFSDCLREMGFTPSIAEPDIWFRPNKDRYEYIAVYVDDLALAMENPQAFADELSNKYKFNLKGTGPIQFHLGMDFVRDDDGTLCLAPTKYIEKILSNYQRLFGESPKQKFSSPLEKGDHPELDTSELLGPDDIVIYHSLIGALQWLVSIGRCDIHSAVMTLSGFRESPRKGHLDRVKRIYGYLSKMRHASIRIRTEEPDYSDLPIPSYDWSTSIYGKLEELKPRNAPLPLGKPVTLTHYVDANLMHDISTGRSVTGILHLVNKTPIDWYCKKQATVETATYGSEFVAARTCVEQIIELRNTLRYLGVPVRESSFMFGDNQSVVNSSMQVHGQLHKRHTMLSFHRVREAIASGYVTFHFISGERNPADILSKHWGYAQIWTRLKALLFWKGDTRDIE